MFVVTLSGRSQWPLDFWHCELEYRRGHGCVSLGSVACCPVEVSASGCSLVQRIA